MQAHVSEARRGAPRSSRFEKWATRLVDVAAAADGYVVGEELEGDYFQDGHKELVRPEDVEDVFDPLSDVLVAS